MTSTAHPIEFLKRGLIVVGISFGIAVGMALARPHFGFTRQLVYAEAIGLISWALIDFGRFAVRRSPGREWPEGWRGFALPAIGTVLGNLAGSSVGDLVTGHSRWSMMSASPQAVLGQLFLMLAIGGTISYIFWARGRSAHLEGVVEQTRREAAEAQLMLLQSQLEPHMLFNTLANLRALIGTDPPRAQSLLDHLIDYLRSTLGATRATLHPLSTEFARTADYLALMQVRMGERLQVQLQLPDDLADHPGPTLLLQPLVENAVKHGLEPHVEGGRLGVSAARERTQLVLTVRDTGAGLGATPSDGTRFGLMQVRQRLATLYGASATLTLSAAADDAGGTLATVRIPWAAGR